MNSRDVVIRKNRNKSNTYRNIEQPADTNTHKKTILSIPALQSGMNEGTETVRWETKNEILGIF